MSLIRHLLLLCTALSFIHISPLYAEASSEPHFDPFEESWHWVDSDGGAREFTLNLSSQRIEQLQQQHLKLTYALAYPMQALSSYLTPRLNYAARMIRRMEPISNEELIAVLESDNIDLNNPGMLMMWDAYQQYRFDAYRHMNLSPCESAEGSEQLCVRPNYSQLFYYSRGYLTQIAEQFRSQHGLNQSVQNIRRWLVNIPHKSESQQSFSSPLNVLTSNLADSDERALLMAVLISVIAPQYPLHMMYLKNSNGSASPAWLLIDATSGLKGTQVIIDERAHTLLSGPAELIKQAMRDKQTLITDTLY